MCDALVIDCCCYCWIVVSAALFCPVIGCRLLPHLDQCLAFFCCPSRVSLHCFSHCHTHHAGPHAERAGPQRADCRSPDSLLAHSRKPRFVFVFLLSVAVALASCAFAFGRKILLFSLICCSRPLFLSLLS